MPIKVQQTLYMTMIPLYFVKRVLNKLLGRSLNQMTWREKMQDLTDFFSVRYQHRFAEREIVEWFRELNCANVTVAYQEKHGFGVRGDCTMESRRELNPDVSGGLAGARHRELARSLAKDAPPSIEVDR